MKANKKKVSPKKSKKPSPNHNSSCTSSYIKSLIRTKFLLLHLQQQTSTNPYSINLQQLSQLNYYLYKIPTQFTIRLINHHHNTMKILLNIFVRITQHKEIVICCIIRVLQICMYEGINDIGSRQNNRKQGKQQKQYYQQDNYVNQIKEYVRLVNFWADLNNSSKSMASIEGLTMKESLRKLLSWCEIINKYKCITDDIKECLQKFTIN